MAKSIEQVDPNFREKSIESTIVYRDLRDTAAVIYGLRGEGYSRMPQAAADKVSEGVAYLNTHTSGGRIRFRTDSRRVGVRVRLAADAAAYFMPHMAMTGICGVDVFAGTGANARNVTLIRPPMNSNLVEGEFLLSEPELITLYLPLYGAAASVEIGVEDGAAILPPAPYPNTSPIVFYGSSITQGGCASKPGNSYPAMVERLLERDIYVLGFSGNAMGEQTMAEYIASLDMSCFVYDYDHNAPSAAHLEKTHRPFLETILKAHPGLPIVFMSKPNPDLDGEGSLRREIIRETWKWAQKQGHPTVFLDGSRLLGEDALDCCTVDGVHPTDLGFYRMAQQVSEAVRELGI